MLHILLQDGYLIVSADEPGVAVDEVGILQLGQQVRDVIDDLVFVMLLPSQELPN